MNRSETIACVICSGIPAPLPGRGDCARIRAVEILFFWSHS